MLRTRGGRRITAHGTGPVAASFRLPTLPSADSQGTSLWVQRFSAGLDRVPKGAEAPLPPEAKSRPGAARPPAAGCARPPRSRRAVYRRDAAATRVFETSFVSSRREISAQDQEGYGHPEAGVGPAGVCPPASTRRGGGRRRPPNWACRAGAASPQEPRPRRGHSPGRPAARAPRSGEAARPDKCLRTVGRRLRARSRRQRRDSALCPSALRRAASGCPPAARWTGKRVPGAAGGAGGGGARRPRPPGSFKGAGVHGPRLPSLRTLLR